ncbi:hypothetical protein BD626DRAFT_489952 [Schizophyllum amplum]|uniref:Uncharacterized protein n=1 Tax=Schizophyllum amplum TaxID=97359 RepID=A0A550CJ62_9AGAR|nr:hypothetical protein BD626DRAFT_489952 [Auriculariopsis ampla]
MVEAISFFTWSDYSIPLCKSCNRTFHVKCAMPPPPESNPILRSGHTPSDAELQSVSATINEMEECADNLKNELCALQEMMDRLRSTEYVLRSVLDVHRAYVAPIRRLPVEILAEVMDWACGVNANLLERDCMPLTLSAVCKSWRDLMLASPILWARWSLDINNATRTMACVVTPRLELFLDRSGDIPISQIIEHGYRTYQNADKAPIAHILLQHTHRWQHLDLLSVENAKEFHLLEGRPLPQVKTLLGGPQQLRFAVISGVFNGFPALRSVRVCAGQSEVIPDLPWGQLESLRATPSRPGYALALLQRCPNLRRWTYDTGVRRFDIVPMPRVNIVLHQLRKLSIDMAQQHDDNPLKHITAPALEALILRWTYTRAAPTIADPLPPFLARSSCPLRRLELHQPLHVDFACLRTLRSLVALRISYAKAALLSPLGSQPSELYAHLSKDDILPQLEVLELWGEDRTWPDVLYELIGIRQHDGRPLQKVKWNDLDLIDEFGDA